MTGYSETAENSGIFLTPYLDTSEGIEIDSGAIDAPKTGFRAAIDAMCKQCIYDPSPGNGTWRQQVEACPSKDCPLYPLRPVSEGGTR